MTDNAECSPSSTPKPYYPIQHQLVRKGRRPLVYTSIQSAVRRGWMLFHRHRSGPRLPQWAPQPTPPWHVLGIQSRVCHNVRMTRRPVSGKRAHHKAPSHALTCLADSQHGSSFVRRVQSADYRSGHPPSLEVLEKDTKDLEGVC